MIRLFFMQQSLRQTVHLDKADHNNDGNLTGGYTAGYYTQECMAHTELGHRAPHKNFCNTKSLDF
jgi:hypothetical protein